MKNVLSLAFAFIILITFSGCDENIKNPKYTDESVLRIGWLGPLTGESASEGNCELQALTMLVEQQNEEGGILGKTIELIGYDTRGDAQGAEGEARKLIADNRVCAIIGPNSSAQAIYASHIFSEYGVPSIATLATSKKVTLDDEGNLKPYNFRVCIDNKYQAEVLARYIHDNEGIRTAGIIVEKGNKYSEEMAEDFRSEFTKIGGVVTIAESYVKGQHDYIEMMLRVKNINPEAIFLPGEPVEVTLISNQARQYGIDSVFLGTDTWLNPLLLLLSEDSLEGSIIVDHANKNDLAVMEFGAKYYNRWGEELVMSGCLANDAFLLLKEAIEYAGTDNPNDIVKGLTSVSVKGLTGTIKLDSTTHNPIGKKAVITTIKNDEFVVDEEYVPSTYSE